MLRNYFLDGNPCTRECAERIPGCNCDKRKKWVAQKEQRRKIVAKDKERTAMLDHMSMSSKKKKRQV